MSGLSLKLAPGERLLINGAVIENGDRRTKISIRTPGVHVLRLRDAIHPDKATTPVSRLCCLMQQVLSGDVTADEARQDLLFGLERLSRVFDDRDSRSALDAATVDVIGNAHYPALRRLRGLLPREARLLAQAG